MNRAVTEFPMLYKNNKGGALLTWTVFVQEDAGTPGAGNIVTLFGQKGGLIQRTEDLVTNGKNLGKKNETSALQQAINEAQSRWEKQVKRGYVEDIDRAKAGESDLVGVEPMLAHVYGTIFEGIFTGEYDDRITFPAAVQPKLDGFRSLTRSDWTLWSKTQKPWNSVPHIPEAIRALFPAQAPPLDGELYNHALKSDFEKIASIVNQKKQVDPDHQLVQYHVYDLALPDVPFSERFAILRQTVGELGPNAPLVMVETIIATSHEDVLKAFHHFKARGYEGAMVRNLTTGYEQTRSYNLLKLKEFNDAEFKIVGASEGRGKLAGRLAAFVCITPSGETFEAPPEGDLGGLERAKEFWEHPELWQGKTLTVKFQGYTGKKQVPRFPKAVRFREDE